MPVEDFIIHVFCLAENFIKHDLDCNTLRKRGFNPSLTDSEVITMRLVGEYLGFGDEKPIWEYFKRHWLEWFPRLGCRTTFTRQSANLWFVTQKLQKQLLKIMSADIDDLHICDCFPIPVCHIKRSGFCRKFKGEADYGYCASKGEHYYGFKSCTSRKKSLGRVINYRLLDCKWRFSALPFLKIRLKYSCDTVLKTRHLQSKILQSMTRPRKIANFLLL